MPPETTRNEGHGLAIIAYSGTYEKVHYALAMASAAAAVGRPIHLFFTMTAIQALEQGESEQDSGWRRLPTEDGSTAAEKDAANRSNGIADFETLMTACRELDVHFLVCEMGLKAMQIERHGLRQDIAIEEGGLATVMLESNGGSLVFV